MTTKENKYTPEKYEKGFNICIASAKRNPYSKLTYIKSNNYLENILEKDTATKNGYNETIFLNTSDNISEGTYTNIFFVRDNTVYTPSISCGILPGIMRDKVISLINRLSIKLEIGQFNKDDLLEADEIFLTNSLMEIMPVWKLENKIFDLANNTITKLLRKEFHSLYYSHTGTNEVI
jgi:branched-subunit amino acid aminotransferase/4-amino-4-deoxychorismate lyase